MGRLGRPEDKLGESMSRFFADNGHLYFDGVGGARVRLTSSYAYESARELAEFLNWLHELYTRERQQLPGKSGFEAANCSADGLCFGELDGRCG